MTDAMNKLMEYCRANNRVCPRSSQWTKLMLLLPNTKRNNSGGWDEPYGPMILGALIDNDGCLVPLDTARRERFFLHLKWAADHNAINGVEKFLKNLSEEDWCHGEHEL